ncbi:MAG: PEP-CTERM sorting domain-containing protein [Pseudomonadota bacterium]
MKFPSAVFAAAAVVFCGSAFATGTATVNLSGGSFIQAGSVLNTSGSGIDIVGVVYDLGPQVAGAAIWELYSSTGTQSNFLTGSWYSTESWTGLSVGSGNTFSFSGLDIDLIVSTLPANVTSSTLGAPSSLAGATFSVYFSDNSWGTAQLNQATWDTNQTLTINAVSAVPEPESYAMLLAGLGLMGAVARRRKSKQA